MRREINISAILRVEYGEGEAGPGRDRGKTTEGERRSQKDKETKQCRILHLQRTNSIQRRSIIHVKIAAIDQPRAGRRLRDERKGAH